MIIYKVTNKINGKIYIGQTCRSLEKRWSEHCKFEGYLSSSILKYGKDNFTIEIIDSAENPDILDKKEQEYISKFNSLVPNGYNLNTGGKSGRKASMETRDKISKSLIGNQRQLGLKRTIETKLKMSKSAKGNPKPKARRPVIAIDKNGNIQEFESVNSASEILKIGRRSISNCLSGYSFRAGGFNFQYKEKKND